MFETVSKWIVSNGVKNGVIEKDRSEEYIYGMNMLLEIALNVVSMVIIGIILNKFWECIVFCVVYKTIRKYTGGFHFERAWCCYVSSCAMYVMIAYMVEYVPFKGFEITALTAVSAIIIWIISPVEAIHKPLDECEKLVFRKRARINIAFILIAYAISLFIYDELAYVIGMGIISSMFFAILGCMKVIRYRR